jgi:imidazolonepropionase-like amidohydrolase
MPDWLLIKHTSVLDGSGQPPSGPASVLVHGDIIRRIGEVSEADIPRGESLEVIDGTGKTLMPGLIDAHCHTTFGETYQQEEQDLYTSVETRTLRAAWNLKKVLQAGVTGISDPGGSYFISVGLREGVRTNIVDGPRMFSAGRFISTSNGIADWYPTSVGVPDSGIGMVCNDPHAMVAEVRRQVKNGVDLIKIGDSPMGDYQAFMDSEIALIADVAHMLNKRVTIHARGSANVDGAVKAGVDWIMHGNSMTDETIERLAESKIPLVPTLTLLGNLRDWGHLAGVPQAKVDAYDRLLDKTAVSLHKAHEAGVTLIAGTDSGFAVTPYGEWHARELELLMELAGLSALEAIKAATSSAAVVLGLQGQVGEVREGYLADLLLVNGNPAEDVRILQDPTRISEVISRGQRVDLTYRDSRPYNRAQVISAGRLTRALVKGEPGGESGQPAGWSAEQAADLASDIARRKAAARIR